MRSRPLRAAIAAATILSLNGCADLPVVGGLGESLAGVTAPVMAMLDPVLAPFFPKVEPTPAPMMPRRRRRRPLTPEGTAVATGSVGTESVQVAPAVAYATWAERNKRFDRLRTEGLMRLYRGQTGGALDAFKQAQTLRPEDPQIARLVALVQNPPAPSPITGLRGMPGGAPNAQPDSGASGLPPGITPEMLKRAEQFSQQQQQGTPPGAPPVMPQGGDQPAGLFP
ncbi:MAG TPA: hypothetical protein V6D00_09410 [Pantanalinema sp.]